MLTAPFNGSILYNILKNERIFNMALFLNKILATLIIPLMLNTSLPFFSILKLVNYPKQVISVSEEGIGSEADPVYFTAHRGVTATAPENSLPSYEKAVELGYYSAECDIRLTKDGHWVLSHNSSTSKMFWVDVEVEASTLAELKELEYMSGANFWEYDDLHIATLDEYLDIFVGSNTRPQIEIKSEDYDSLYTIIDAVKAKGLAEQSIVISFDLKQLEVIHELDSSIELWYLVDEITEENISEAKAISDNVWLSANFEENDEASIKLAVDAEVPVSFWTVNTVEDAKMLYDMGIRYIETDILCN